MSDGSESAPAFGALDDRTLLAAAQVAADDDVRSEMVFELQRRGSADICERAIQLAASIEPADRELAAEVLGDLGVLEDHPHADRSLPTLIDLAGDSDISVTIAAIHGLRPQHDPRARVVVVGHAGHTDPEVRLAVAQALPSLLGDGRVDPASPVVRTLMALMTDAEDGVRDWATFGLGQLVAVDGDEVRRALVDRLDDVDADTRREALIGLARRRDPRAVDLTLAAFERDDDQEVAVRAAELLRSPVLLSAIERFREATDEPTLADLAMRRSDPVQQAEETARIRELVELAEGLLPDVRLDVISELMPVDDGGVSIDVHVGRRTGTYYFDSLIERAGGSAARSIEIIASDQRGDGGGS